MTLSEIAERAKKAMAGESRLTSLDLKSALGDPAQWYARHGYRNIAAALSASAPVWSGEPVSQESALNHSVVFACTRIIAESVAFLPLALMRKVNGDRTEPTGHPLYSAIRNGSAEFSSQRFRELLTVHCVLGGNAYAQVLRRTSTGVAYGLVPLLPSQVNVEREKEGARRVVYTVSNAGSSDKRYVVEEGKPQDILHIPGITTGTDFLKGDSVIVQARQSIGTAIAAERHVGRFYARGGRLPYYLQMKDGFNWESDEDFKKFRHDWDSTYADPHKAPMLPPFVEKYEQIGVSAADAQLLETRQFSVSEICRWFRIPPHMAGDLSRSTNNNIEHQSLEFYTATLLPWLNRWESELKRCVLTPEEIDGGYYFKHNADAILRGDFKTRMEGYSIGLQNGFFNRNEVRELEDRDAFQGGDDYTIQLNMQALPLAKDPQAQQSGLFRVGTRRKQ